MAANPRIDQPRNYFAIDNNIAPGTSDFACDAGVYTLDAHASAWGTLQLRMLVVDPTLGAIYTLVGAAIAADGHTVYDLAAGRYNLVAAGTTALTARFQRTGRRGSY